MFLFSPFLVVMFSYHHLSFVALFVMIALDLVYDVDFLNDRLLHFPSTFPSFFLVDLYNTAKYLTHVFLVKFLKPSITLFLPANTTITRRSH
jgi:hypothetical protein